MRRVLLVGFHFPPIQGSSGVHRIVAFARYLQEFGWQANVLTVNERALPGALDTNDKMVPPNVRVIRAPAWDAAKHFAVAGRYPGLLALPDRWSSWIPGGIMAGLREVDRTPYDAIYSTFPIASAHVIGRSISRRRGLPWIADFRDPMASRTYPASPLVRACWTKIQDRAMQEAARVIVVTPGLAQRYEAMYPDMDHSKICVIPNGFDPEAMPELTTAGSAEAAVPENGRRRLLLLHSGTIYPSERDPEQLFRALRKLRSEGKLDPADVEIRLRGCGSEERFGEMIARYGIGDLVSMEPNLAYGEALAEMRSADALLLLQGRSCNQQVPAKAYEYLYFGKPVLALADPEGDTGTLMQRFGVPGIVALEDAEGIASMLAEQLPRIRAGTYPVPDRRDVMSLSRRNGAKELARQLDAVASDAAARGETYRLRSARGARCP